MGAFLVQGKEDRPEYGKQYALTGGPDTKCIMNGCSRKDSEVIEGKEQKLLVPAEVRRSDFGCPNCLWSGCECKQGSMYKEELESKNKQCAAYTYYD